MQNPIWQWNEKCIAKLSDFLSAEAKKAIFQLTIKRKEAKNLIIFSLERFKMKLQILFDFISLWSKKKLLWEAGSLSHRIDGDKS